MRHEPLVARAPTAHKKSEETWHKTGEEYVAVVEWLRAQGPWFEREGGADHIWIFPSGRGASIFPQWRQHIPHAIFLTPEGDTRSGHVEPRHKDVVIPGYRNTSAMDAALLARVANEGAAGEGAVMRPTMLFFRGSFTSERPGEEHFSEGVRLAMQETLAAFRMPRHLALARSQAAAAAMATAAAGGRRRLPAVIYSNASVGSGQYHAEMAASDFCLAPMGSTSWTLRLYDALLLGCIPILLSDHVALPWAGRVEWRALVLKWPQAEAALTN